MLKLDLVLFDDFQLHLSHYKKDKFLEEEKKLISNMKWSIKWRRKLEEIF